MAETGEQSVSIVIFAALPVTLLTALSKSDLGKVSTTCCHTHSPLKVLRLLSVFLSLPLVEQKVQEQLFERLPDLDAKADELKARHQEARESSPW